MMHPARRYLTDEELRLFDLSLTDEVKVHQKVFLRFFQFLGTTVMSRGENGLLGCYWMSFSCYYSLFFLLSHIYYIYVATAERRDLMNRLRNRSFDEDLFLYSLYIFFLFTGLAITCIVESKKLVTYYNLLSFFQMRYYHVKGKRLNLKLRFIDKYFSVLFGSVIIIVLIVTYVIVVHSIYKKLENYSLQALVENVIACGFVIVDIVSLLMLLITNFMSLYKIANILVDEIQEAFKTGNDKLVEDYEKLWIDFVYITRQFVNAVSYSVGYYFILGILATTFEFYLAIREEYTILALFGVGIWFSIMSALMTCGQLMYKLTDNLKFHLVDIRKIASHERKQKLNKFFKLIRHCQGSLKLGGFASLDNKLASSILKTITTYIVILLQFRQVDENGNSES